jgi:Zn-finger nucleic acid-binding protein
MTEIKDVGVIGGPEVRQTLWRCHHCAALIAIYSVKMIEMAICPICCDVTLDKRGSFEAILGMTLQERSHSAS